MNFENKLNYFDLLMLFDKKVLAPIDLKISKPLKEHLLQRICEPFYFLLNYDEDFKSYTLNIYDLDKIINKTNLRQKNQSLHLNYFKQIKLLWTFFVYCNFALIYIIFAKKLKPIHKLNLVYGLAHEHIYLNSKEITCVNFFEELNPLWKEVDTQILIESRKPSLFYEKSKSNFRVVFDIYLYMLRYKSISKYRN